MAVTAWLWRRKARLGRWWVNSDPALAGWRAGIVPVAEGLMRKPSIRIYRHAKQAQFLPSVGPLRGVPLLRSSGDLTSAAWLAAAVLLALSASGPAAAASKGEVMRMVSEEAARSNRVPVALALAVAKVESDFDAGDLVPITSNPSYKNLRTTRCPRAPDAPVTRTRLCEAADEETELIVAKDILADAQPG